MNTSKQSKLQFSVKIPQRYGENCDNTKTFKVKLEDISYVLLSKLSYYRKGALETYYLDEALEFRPYFNKRIRHAYVIQELFKICFVHQLFLHFPEYNLFGENSETSNNVKEDGFIYFLPIFLDKVTVDAAESEVKFNMNFFDQILVAPLFHNPDTEEQLDFSHEIDDVWMLIPSYLFVNQRGVQLVGEGAVGGRYCLCALNLKTIFTNMRRMLSGYFRHSEESLDKQRKKLFRKEKSAETRRKNKSAERRKKKKRSAEFINLIEEEEEEEEIIIDSSAERSSGGESNYGSGSEWESDWESVDEDIEEEEEEEEENKSHQLDDHQPNNNIPSFYSSPPTSPLVVSTSIVSTFQKPPNTPYSMSSSSTSSSSPHQMRHQQPPRNHSPYPHNNNQPPQCQSTPFQAGHPQQNQGIMNKGTTTKKKRMRKFQDPLLTPYNPNKSLKEVEDERNSWNQQQKEEVEEEAMMIQHHQVRNDQHHPPSNYFQSRPPPHISSSSNGQPNQQQQIYQQTNPLPPPPPPNSNQPSRNQPMNPPPYQNNMPSNPIHLTTNTNSQARGFVQQQPHYSINSWGNEPQPTNHHHQQLPPNLPPNIFLNRGDHRFQTSTSSGLSPSMHQFLLQQQQQQQNISSRTGENLKIIQSEEEVHQVKKKRRRRRKKPEEEQQQIEEISLLEDEDQMTEIILPVDENGLVDTASIMALEKPNTKTKKGSRGTRSKEQLTSDVYKNGRKIRTAAQIKEHKEDLKRRKYQYVKYDPSQLPQI